MDNKLNEHEQLFPIYPVGVKYICEFCKNGEMQVDTSEPMLACDPPLIAHRCNKCGKIMHLPKQYPYIEWKSQPIEL